MGSALRRARDLRFYSSERCCLACWYTLEIDLYIGQAGVLANISILQIEWYLSMFWCISIKIPN